MTEIVLGFTDMPPGIARRVSAAEDVPSLLAWTLFVRRGPVAPHLECDGVIVAARTSPVGPVPPYTCYLALEFSGPAPAEYTMGGERDTHARGEVLRREATGLGTFNLVRSVARAGSVETRIAPGFRA